MTIAATSILRQVASSIRRSYLSLGNTRGCPICGWTGHSFLLRHYPEKPAAVSVCPVCRSNERHRFAYLALEKRLVPASQSVLHIAPETCVEPWLRSVATDYLSIDLCAPNAMAHMSITELRVADDSFGLIWCAHVLEHVDDDRKAMAELFRVLRPGGLAIIMVPVYGADTYEDPSITDPRERLRHFKQEDHVRLYGLDVTDRLVAAGFTAEVLRPTLFSEETRRRYALEYPSTNEIFLCTKDVGGQRGTVAAGAG